MTRPARRSWGDTALGLFAVVAAGCASKAAGPGPAAPVIVAAVLPSANPEARVAFDEGVRLLGLGPQNYESARDKFQRATKLDPKLYEAWHNVGFVESKLGRFDRAADAFRQALAVQPASKPTAVALAETLMKAQQYDDAEVFLKKRLAASDDIDLRFTYVAALREDGKTADALEQVREVLARDSHNVRAFNALGLVYAKMDKPALAETAFRRAIELDPKAAQVWNNLGLVLLARGHDQDAFAAFQKASQIDDHYKEALLNQAVVYLDCGDYEKARTQLEKAAAIDPSDPAIWVTLAVAQRGLKKFEEAEKNYLRALDLQPDYAPALYDLGILYMDFREQKTKAREQLLHYRKVAASNDPKRQDALARLKELKSQ